MGKVVSRASGGIFVMTLGLASGCSTPMGGPRDADLRRSIVESTRREIEEAKATPAPWTPAPVRDPLRFTPERVQELDAISGQGAYGEIAPPLEKDLLGNTTQTVGLSLQQAITRAVERNLDLQLARLDAAASQTDIVIAEALFDWTFFADTNLSLTDEPSIVAAVNGVPIGNPQTKNDLIVFDAGFRKALITGGQFDITQALSIFNNRSPGRETIPDPARTSTLEIELTQPLLRNFGSDVALSEVRLARNTERNTLEQLRADLIRTITDVENGYWNLVFAYRDVQITQRLLDRGVQTRDVLASRLQFDVKPAEFSDAVATVERRRTALIRAINLLRQRSDVLKALMNDPELTVGGEAVLLPMDEPPSAPLAFSLLDSITTAFALRPEIQQAILAIDDASIREEVADNARLPLLDLQVATTLTGLNDSAQGALDQQFTGRFIDYAVGLSFEQPIGNRAAESGFRRARLERLRSVVAYRSAAQDVVVDVKAALRNIVTNYELLEQTRMARLAAAENVRTLTVEEENIRSLTSDFLNLKFTRQDALATAERDELQSIVDYNIAIADLAAAIGSTLARNQIRLVAPSPGDPIESIDTRASADHDDAAR